MKANKKNLWNHHSEEIQGPVGILIAISSPVSMLLPQITEPIYRICHAQISKKKTLKDHHLTWFKGIFSQSQLFKYNLGYVSECPNSSAPMKPYSSIECCFKFQPHLVTYGLAMLTKKRQLCRKTSWDFDPFNSERLQGSSDTVGQAGIHWYHSSRQGLANGTIVHHASTGFFQVKRCWWWKRAANTTCCHPQENQMTWRKVLSVQALRWPPWSSKALLQGLISRGDSNELRDEGEGTWHYSPVTAKTLQYQNNETLSSMETRWNTYLHHTTHVDINWQYTWINYNIHIW